MQAERKSHMNEKKIHALGIIILLLVLGTYLFFQPIHIPRWMTYPYDVTFLGGQATINSYLSDKKVNIPVKVWGYTITDIQGNCFLDLDIEEVTIPETITYIGGGAFSGCKNLAQIVLPSHLEELGNHAFMYSGIQEIILPQTVKEMGEEAFAYSSLKEITGLENVEYIGDRAFRGTPWEDSIEEEFVCIDDILYLYKGAETEVVIPSTIKEIRGGFYKEDEYPYPINVTKVFVPESVTVISPESFAGQKGLEVYIPESVISLGDDYGNPSDPYKECIFENIKDGTIVTTEGSTAEAYAISQRIPYRIITEEEMQQEMESAERRP